MNKTHTTFRSLGLYCNKKDAMRAVWAAAYTLCTLTLLGVNLSGHALAADPAGQVAELIGIVQVQRGSDSTPWRSLRFADPVYVGDTVRTEAGATVKLMFNDRSVITIGPSTRLRVDESVYQQAPIEQRSSVFNLFEGKVRALVSKFFSGGNNRFEVRTPSAVAGVRGTEFITAVDASGNTDIVVFEGVVEVYNRRDRQQRAVFLGEGMGSRVQTNRTPSAPRQFTPEQLREIQEQIDIDGNDTLFEDSSGDAASGDPINQDQGSDMAGLSGGPGGDESSGEGEPGGELSDDTQDFNEIGNGDEFADLVNDIDNDLLSGRLDGQDVETQTRVQIDVDFR